MNSPLRLKAYIWKDWTRFISSVIFSVFLLYLLSSHVLLNANTAPPGPEFNIYSTHTNTAPEVTLSYTQKQLMFSFFFAGKRERCPEVPCYKFWQPWWHPQESSYSRFLLNPAKRKASNILKSSPFFPIQTLVQLLKMLQDVTSKWQFAILERLVITLNIRNILPLKSKLPVGWKKSQKYQQQS